MNIKFYIWFSVSFILFSCSKETNNFLPENTLEKGIHENKLEVLSNSSNIKLPSTDINSGHFLQLFGVMNSLGIQYLSDTAQSRIILAGIDSNYNVSGIDFDRYVLIPIYYSLGKVYLGDARFQLKYLLDYRKKDAILSIKSVRNGNSSGLNTDYKTVSYSHWIKLPKLPAGFAFKKDFD
jgi:hypothetical protein